MDLVTARHVLPRTCLHCILGACAFHGPSVRNPGFVVLNRSYPLYFIAYSPMITAWCNRGVIFGICSSGWLAQDYQRWRKSALGKLHLCFCWGVEELLNTKLSLLWEIMRSIPWSQSWYAFAIFIVTHTGTYRPYLEPIVTIQEPVCSHARQHCEIDLLANVAMWSHTLRILLSLKSVSVKII